MEDRQYTRVDTIRVYVDRMLLEQTDLENRRCGYVHLYGVGMAAALIALKRGHDRAYAELAQIAGMLHDYGKYQNPSCADHAHAAEPIARAILDESHEFSTDETEMICHAVYHHSDKNEIGTPFDEILKDADVLHHWLRNPMENCYFDTHESERIQMLIREFSLTV